MHDTTDLSMVRLAMIVVLLMQVGCASVKSPGFLNFRDKVGNNAKSKDQSEFELQLAVAQSAEKRGEVDSALATYQHLEEQGQATADIYHRMALIQDRKGQSSKAEKYYLACLKIDPAQAPVMCDYGYSLYLQESLELAEAQYRKAIETDPQFLPARVNLGMLLARTDRFDEALRQFALGGLSEAEAHHNVALAATENGNSKVALTALDLSRKADEGKKSSTDRQSLEQVVLRLAAYQEN